MSWRKFSFSSAYFRKPSAVNDTDFPHIFAPSVSIWPQAGLRMPGMFLTMWGPAPISKPLLRTVTYRYADHTNVSVFALVLFRQECDLNKIRTLIFRARKTLSLRHFPQEDKEDILLHYKKVLVF